jgi:hypothetical protein
MKTPLIATLIFVVTSTGAALAAEKCDVPVAEWQSRAALRTKLEADGWQVRSIKTEDGCYEAYAVDKDGKRVEAYFNPKTFERVGDDDDESEG